MKKIMFLLNVLCFIANLYSADYKSGYVINDTHVNIRTGPGLEFSIITQLNPGDEIIPLELTDKSDSIGKWHSRWFKIRLLNGEIGYVYGPFVSFRFGSNLSEGTCGIFSITNGILERDFLDSYRNRKTVAKFYEKFMEIGKEFEIYTFNKYSDYRDTIVEGFNSNANRVVETKLGDNYIFAFPGMDRNFFVKDYEHFIAKYDSDINIYNKKIKEKNIEYYNIYNAIINKIVAAGEEYAEQKGLDINFTNFRTIIDVVELKEKTLVVFDITYLEDAYFNKPHNNLSEGENKRNAIAVEYKNYYIFDRNNNFLIVPPVLENPKILAVSRYRGISGTELKMVTDIDNDNNPELWYEGYGYENLYKYIQFMTDDYKWYTTNYDQSGM